MQKELFLERKLLNAGSVHSASKAFVTCIYGTKSIHAKLPSMHKYTYTHTNQGDKWMKLKQILIRSFKRPIFQNKQEFRGKGACAINFLLGTEELCLSITYA